LPKITFEKIVKVDRKKFFELTTNYENFQKILPHYYPSVRLISVRGNTSVVEEHLLLGGKELVMMVKHIIDEPVLHELFVIGGNAKGTHIIKKYEQLPNGTKLIVDIDWKLKGLSKFSAVFNKNNILNEYSKMIDEFVTIAEF